MSWRDVMNVTRVGVDLICYRTNEVRSFIGRLITHGRTILNLGQMRTLLLPWRYTDREARVEP
jgi:hypothetical protein